MANIKALVVFLGLTILTCCEKEDRISLEDQKLYFEFRYINYAWGFQYLHWVIDYQGKVLLNTTNNSIITISANDIRYGNACFDSVIYKVDPKELDHYINLLPSASKGRIRCEDRHRADFGGNEFNAFYRDRTVLLSSMSDIQDCTNRNNKAAEIDRWLKDLHNTIFSNK